MACTKKQDGLKLFNSKATFSSIRGCGILDPIQSYSSVFSRLDRYNMLGTIVLYTERCAEKLLGCPLWSKQVHAHMYPYSDIYPGCIPQNKKWGSLEDTVETGPYLVSNRAARQSLCPPPRLGKPHQPTRGALPTNPAPRTPRHSRALGPPFCPLLPQRAAPRPPA